MDSLESNAACDLEICWLSKLNEYMKVDEVPLTLAWSNMIQISKYLLVTLITRFSESIPTYFEALF